MKRCLLLVLVAGFALPALGQFGGELRFCLKADPKTFNPVTVSDEPGEIIRYLTGGTLVRLNRVTQKVEPELAESWSVTEHGRSITFQLRQGIRFSDGAPFTSEDIAFTMRVLMDAALHSPTGDSFRTGPGAVVTKTPGDFRITITFPAPVSDLVALFDQVAILSSRGLRKIYAGGAFANALSVNQEPTEIAVLGPFRILEYKPGVQLVLGRNPQYWKVDPAGRRLPYLDGVRLLIQQNRQIEFARFQRGEVHLMNALDPELFENLHSQSPAQAIDSGPSLASEQLWFNQYSPSPIPEYKKQWFRSKTFRRAISSAINRDDLCRVVYKGRARASAGPVSAANRFWTNSNLKPDLFDPAAALAQLKSAGFRLSSTTLFDSAGHPVEFSIVTNAGNKTRERIAAMLQQDLKTIGIRLNVVTLDFPSLLERISRSFNYEACLLGLENLDLDPNSQMNVWLSSASMHQWNPSQPSPATPWEAEIDRLMIAQAGDPSPAKRKALFDRVQQIVQEQAPFLYLINKNALSAVSPALRNVRPAVLHPEILWNVDHLQLAGHGSGARSAR